MKKPFISSRGEIGDLKRHFFLPTKRGRPPLAKAKRKRSVHLMLDPDIVSHLKELKNASAFVNGVLRNRMAVT